MSAPSLTCRVVSPEGRWVYLDQVGRVSGLSYRWDYSGGPASAECSLDTPAGAHHPALSIGSTFTVHRGATQAWAGRVASVDRDAPWKVMADGIGGLAATEPVGITGTLDAIVDDVIADGLPWTRPTSLGGSWAGEDVGTATIDQVLTDTLLGQGKRWTVDLSGALRAETQPTTPTLIVRADTTPPLTLNDYATHVTARYGATSGGAPVFQTVRVSNELAAARFGRVNRSIDLSGLGTLSEATATSTAQRYLDRVSPQMTVTGDFQVTAGQITTASGGPVDLPLVRPGQLARIHLVSLVRDALVVPTTSIDMLIGGTGYDADSGALTLSPIAKAATPLQIMFGGRATLTEGT